MNIKLLLPFLSVILLAGCNPGRHGQMPKPKFGALKGIGYTEVKRRFSNGLMFNTTGYELEPSWRMSFLSDDSVKLFSAERGKFYNFKIYLDHDSVINTANTWFKVKKANADSLVFQVLFVKNKDILDAESNIFMTFYSDKLIAKLPPLNVMHMGLPSARDTAFIKQLSAKTNADSTKFFAGRQPVEIKSINPDIQVEKQKYVKSFLTTAVQDDEYMHPEYHITIHKAYDNFFYRFSAYVDAGGQLHFKEPLIEIEDFKDHIIGAMKGLINGYFKYYLQVKPGRTLDIPHNTSIIIEAKGIKDK